MRRIKKKLNSRRGASMMMALAFLLVSLVLGGVVLTSAQANAGRLRSNRQDQQDYLAVVSAARLVDREMGRLQFEGSYTHVTTVTSKRKNPDADYVVTGTKETAEEAVAQLTGSILLSQSGIDLKAAWANAPATVHSSLLNIPAPKETVLEKELVIPGDAARGIPEVRGKLTVAVRGSRLYNMEYQLYVPGSLADGTLLKKQAMTLRYQAKANTAGLGLGESQESYLPGTYQNKWGWDATDTEQTKIVTSKTKYTTTVTWVPEGDMKGGAA